MLRLSVVFLGFSLLFASGCSLGNNDCDVFTTIASSTSAESPSAPQDWTNGICSPTERMSCEDSIPPHTSFMLCEHASEVVVAEDGGAPMLGLKCASYKSGESSCQASDDDSHHHHVDLGGLSPPNG